MNQETYEALKRLMKYGTWDEGIGDNDVTAVENWIEAKDEKLKENQENWDNNKLNN